MWIILMTVKMVMYQLVFYCLLICLSECQVYLNQVNSSEILCPADEVLFICQYYGPPSIVWTFELSNRLSSDFNINGYFDHIGSTESKTVSSTTFEAELLYTNSTYIMSSLTIRITLEANLSRITCNRKTVILTLPQYESLLPSHLFLYPQEKFQDVFSYVAEWISASEYFYLSIIPSMGNKSDLIIINGTNTTLYLLENKNYSVNIRICPSLNISAQFLIESCLINTSYVEQEISYTIFSNETWSAVCANEEVINTDMLCRDGEITKFCMISIDFHYSDDIFTPTEDTLSQNCTTCSGSNVNMDNFTTLIENGANIATTTIYPSTQVLYIIISTSVTSFTVVISFASVILVVFSLLRKSGKLCCCNYQRKSVLNGDNLHRAQDPQQDKEIYSTLLHNNNKSSNPVLVQNHIQRNDGDPEYDIIPMSNMRNHGTSCSYSSKNYSKIANIKYSDVETRVTLRDYLTYSPEQTKVQYSDVGPNVHPQDKCINLDLLLVQLRSISDSYKEFGSVAGIPTCKLNKITASCSNSSFDGLIEVCDMWLDKCREDKTPPTWHAVAAIVTMIGHKELADKIMDVYTTGKLPVVVDMKSVPLVNTSHPALNCIPDSPIPQHTEIEEKKMCAISTNSASVETSKLDNTDASALKDKPTHMLIEIENIFSPPSNTEVSNDEEEEPPPIPSYRGDSYLNISI